MADGGCISDGRIRNWRAASTTALHRALWLSRVASEMRLGDAREGVASAAPQCLIF